MNKSIRIIILAGGSGSRLFPLSRENYPKQFLALGGGKTLLQQTFLRALNIAGSPDKIFFVANHEYKYHILNQLEEIGHPSEVFKFNLILEPFRKNTAPAIALAVKHLLEAQSISLEEPILVFPSDHIVISEEKFKEYIQLAESAVKKGFIVTFGVVPTRPETGYGYIEADRENLPSANGVYKVLRFHEKPDLSTAKTYLSRGNFYWNSGIFAFSAKTFLEEAKEHAPEIYKPIEKLTFDGMVQHFQEMPDLSLDYAMMEKTKRAVVVPLKDLRWSDVGSWESVYEILEKDRNQNVKIGDVVEIETKDSLLIGSQRVIATIGVEGLVVIETPDIVFVTKRGCGQKIKELLTILQGDADKKKITSQHTTVYRPWGSYTDLEKGDRYRIKRISVNPGECLSLQLHHHRSEHWVVVKGTAKVIVEDEKGERREIFVHENESIYIPKTSKHRLANPGKLPLEVIEVQVGEYIEEDDIVRFEDQYERVFSEPLEKKD